MKPTDSDSSPAFGSTSTSSTRSPQSKGRNEVPSEVASQNAPTTILAPLPNEVKTKEVSQKSGVSRIDEEDGPKNPPSTKMSLCVDSIISPNDGQTSLSGRTGNLESPKASEISLSNTKENLGDAENKLRSRIVTDWAEQGQKNANASQDTKGQTLNDKSALENNKTLKKVEEVANLDNVATVIGNSEKKPLVVHSDAITSNELSNDNMIFSGPVDISNELGYSSNEVSLTTSNHSGEYSTAASSTSTGPIGEGHKRAENTSTGSFLNKSTPTMVKDSRNQVPRHIVLKDASTRPSVLSETVSKRQDVSSRKDEEDPVSVSSSNAGHCTNNSFDKSMSTSISKLSNYTTSRNTEQARQLSGINHPRSMTIGGVNNPNNIGNVNSVHSLNNTQLDNVLGNAPINRDDEALLLTNGNVEEEMNHRLEARDGENGPLRLVYEASIRRQNRPGRKFGAKKKLWVWSWFVQDSSDPNVAVCDYCGKVVRRRPSDKGSPKKLSEHLRTHKLTKTLPNNTKSMPLESAALNYGGSTILMPYTDNEMIQRKSSLALLGLAPQQLHQLPILSQLNLAHSHNTQTPNFPSHGYPQNAIEQERSQNDTSSSAIHGYSNISPHIQQSQQNYNNSISVSGRPSISNQHIHLANFGRLNHQNPPNQLSFQNAHIQPNQSGLSGGQNNILHQNPINQNSHILSGQYGITNRQNNQNNDLSTLSSQNHNVRGQLYSKTSQQKNTQLHREILASNGHGKQNLRQSIQSNQHVLQDLQNGTNDVISPRFHQRSGKSRSNSFEISRQQANMQLESLINDSVREIEVENLFDARFNTDSFDESPYSDTKLLRHLLAFLHENKLSINVIKLPTFRQLVYDLRPESVKDLLVLDTVYSSCVEVARTSSNVQLAPDPVFSMNGPNEPQNS